MGRKIFRWIISLATLLALLSASAFAADAGMQTVRVGLFFGGTALPSANLLNSVGSGYRFGYMDGDTFVTLGTTEETAISMLKTQNIYLLSDGTYSISATDSVGTVGCYHIQLSGSYDSFEAAEEDAALVDGAFPAWIAGTYYVRVGAYATGDEATDALEALGIPDAAVVGTSTYGISVTETKTTRILFQFDSQGNELLVVNPGLDDSDKTVTWFKGYRYYGDFRYERIGGGNLTVVNLVDLEDYIKGVLPYEMSASWPLEALKAQAVCARSYAITSENKHDAMYHFDVCNGTDCQVYHGLNLASSNSDQAVDDTQGICAWYDGEVAETYYYSCNGGASEDVGNVWNCSSSDLPYLKGVEDPYEPAYASMLSGYHWTVTYTADQLTQKLKTKGYDCSDVVDLKVSKFTPMGNVYTITFTDSSGTTYSFSKEKARTTLGLSSMRFTIGGGDTADTEYFINDSGTSVGSVAGLFAIDGTGSIGQLGETPYAVTSSGTQALTGTSSGGSSDGFTITGTGMGHNVGMSQLGAYSMAKQGYTYDQILKFYYTGIDLY